MNESSGAIGKGQPRRDQRGTAAAAKPPAPQAAPGAAAAVRGGDLYNIPPSNLLVRQTAGLESGGEDAIDLSIYGPQKTWKETRERLEQAKIAASKRAEWGKKDDPENGRPGDELYLGGQVWIAKPHGVRAGGKGGPYYAYCLQAQSGCQLLVMNTAERFRDMPNMMGKAMSMPLMKYGLDEVERQIKDAVKDLGAIWEEEKVSRVDPCIDWADLFIATLADLYRSGNYVARPKYHGEFFEEEVIKYGGNVYQFGGRTTGFAFGHGSIHFRAYDKTLECQHDREKRQLLADRRIGNALTATRCELQYRREALKSRYGVSGIDDWRRLRAEIIDDTLTRWLRFTERVPNAKHQAQAKDHELHREMKQRFQKWAGAPHGQLLKPLPKRAPNAEHLRKQALGAARAAYCESLERMPESQEEALHEILFQVVQEAERHNLIEEIRRYIVEHDIKLLEPDDGTDVTQ